MSKIKSISVLTVSLFLLICYLTILFSSCNGYNRNKSHADVPLDNIEKGEALANQYCQSCHLLPSPSMLDEKSWEKGVLPQMGPRLGIFNYNFVSYPAARFDYNLDRKFYPTQPVLKYEEWQNIIDYYTATSPDTIIVDKKDEEPIKENLPLFSPVVPRFRYSPPATSFVKIDESVTNHQ